MGFVLDVTRGVYVMAPADASSRDRAVDCELDRSELPPGLAGEIETVVRQASRTLGIEPPRVRYLPKATPDVRGVVFDGHYDEIWVVLQSPRAARETALHELKHVEQLRGNRYLELKLFTMAERQADADRFARDWKPIERKRGGPLEIKAAGTGWEIAGYASTFGDPPDAYNDVIAPGAFAASIATRETKLLHEHREPIGKQIEIKEDSHGLFGRWSIADTTQGRDTRELVKSGVIDALSIGFVPVKSTARSDGVRVLTEITLYEVSAVAIPANERAVITGAKSASARISVRAEIERRRRQSRRYAGVVPRGR